MELVLDRVSLTQGGERWLDDVDLVLGEGMSVTGPPLSLYRRASKAVCVASGDGKVPGLIAALRAGYITDLIIDERAAAELHDALVPSPKPGPDGGWGGRPRGRTSRRETVSRTVRGTAAPSPARPPTS